MSPALAMNVPALTMAALGGGGIGGVCTYLASTRRIDKVEAKDATTRAWEAAFAAQAAAGDRIAKHLDTVERQLHRLEDEVKDKDRTIVRLQERIDHLEGELAEKDAEIARGGRRTTDPQVIVTSPSPAA